MATNPDTQGATELVPFLGMLRYVVSRAEFNSDAEKLTPYHRQLQQFQYSGSLNKNDWFDVPEVMADREVPSPQLDIPDIVERTDGVPDDTPEEVSEVTAKSDDEIAEIIEAGERADVSEMTPTKTPPQTESEMLAASKNAPVHVDRSPPYAT